MKNRIFLALALVAFTGAAFAAKPMKNGPCARADKMYQLMKDSLNLTADQDAKIKAIHDSACARLQAAKTKSNGDKEAMKAAAKQIMAESRDATKKVLTDAQEKKLKEIHQRNGKKHEKDPAKRAEKMTERMKTELGLNETQTTQVGAANTDLATRMKALKEKKDAGADSAALKSEAKQIHKDYDAKIKGILTAEQYAKWKELKKEGRQKMKEKRAGKKSE